MNFEFSTEQQELRNHVRRFLSDQCPPEKVRSLMEEKSHYDSALWTQMVELGLVNITIPEKYGGLGLGYLEMCVVAEEMGRAVAPVPLSSSIYLAAEFLMHAGTERQKSYWLPRLASGEVVGTFALAEMQGMVSDNCINSKVIDSKISGRKCIVPDGSIAKLAVVAANDDTGLSLYLVDLDGEGVTRREVETIDPSRNHAAVLFDKADAELLGQRGEAWKTIYRVFDAAAILTAFEQVGGAEAALNMGCDYAKKRMAFGRQIGSFQAVKHLLANMYVSLTMARSNAYYGAWALSSNAIKIPEVAAIARVSATRAYLHCAKDNIQVHGGMGFTWEADCHLHYRRSNLLALSLGSLSSWETKLIQRMDVAAA